MLDFLADFCSDKEVLILGDFNLPSLSWDSDDVLMHATRSDRLFFEVFMSLGLDQWVAECTFPRSGNILDLILVSEHDRIGSVQVLPPLPGCDHCTTVCDYLFDVALESPSHTSRPARKWHKGRYGSISRRLEEVNWNFELNYRNAEEAYSRFLEITMPLVEEFVPLADAAGPKARPPWKTNPPTSLRNRKKEAWERYKEVRSRLGRHSPASREAMQSFFAVNRTLRNFAIASQAEYEQNLMEEFKSNPKQLHAYLRRKKVGCPTVGPLETSDGGLTDDPYLMAEAFASSFESVYAKNLPQLVPAAHQTTNSRMPAIVMSTQDVLDTLLALDPTSAAGPDELHAMLLKSCAHQMAYPLSVIFRLSLLECCLPAKWKTSIVVPIYKKGSRYTALNYRPISLTSVSCKCLERIIVKQLYAYLEVNNILSEHQFGFRSGRSTMDQLLLVYHDVSVWLDGGNVVDLILFDFAKAFDVVSHPILLAKLTSLGIERNLICWIQDFLVGRTMCVSVKATLSSHRPVASGVPQGSVMGPILFLIFVNHIASHLLCRYKIFADDLKIYMKISHDPPSHHMRDTQLCQEDISTLHRTASSWGLKLNESKCAVIRFQRKSHSLPPPRYHIDQSPIQQVHSHPDLGVLVDSDLKFHRHIRNTAHKAGGLAQNVMKATVCRSPGFMMTIFCSHIRPILEYCSCVWHTGYRGDLRVLETVQRRWTKLVYDMSEMDYRSRLRALGQYSVQGRLLRADMIQCWKLFHGQCSIAPTDLFTLAPQSGTRGHRYKVSHVRAETDLHKRSFGVRCAETWNSLPDRVVAEDKLASFKVMLADALGDALYKYPP